MIKYENGKLRYFDKNGVEITEGCKIRYDGTVMYPNGRVMEVYLTEDEKLGTDATNPKWIEMGRAVPCEYGIYPLTREETDSAEVV